MRRGKYLLALIISLSFAVIPVRSIAKTQGTSNITEKFEFYLGDAAFLLGNYLLLDSISIAVRSSLANHGLQYFGSRFIKSVEGGDILSAKIRMEFMLDDLEAANKKGILTYEGRSLLTRLKTIVENGSSKAEMAEIKTALKISNNLKTKWVKSVTIPVGGRIVTWALLNAAGAALLDIVLNASEVSPATSYTPSREEYNLYSYCDIRRELNAIHNILEPMPCEYLAKIASTPLSELGPLGYLVKSDSISILEKIECQGLIERAVNILHYGKYGINYRKLYNETMRYWKTLAKPALYDEYVANEANGTNDKWRAMTADYCDSREDFLALLNDE